MEVNVAPVQHHVACLQGLGVQGLNKGTQRGQGTSTRVHLAPEEHSVALSPHVCLDGVPGQDRSCEASLDGLDLAGVVVAVLFHDVPRGDAIGAEAVENGRVKTCTALGPRHMSTACCSYKWQVA